jgi:hypothetical protein
MSVFIKKVISYCLSFLIISILFFYLYKPKWRVGEEVQMVIDLIDQVNPNQIDTIRLGDSVGKNIIGTGSDSNILNLGSNQAISLLGQYFILKKFILKREEGYKNLCIEAYIRPSSFYNNLDQEWTYNYFIKFFYNKDWFFNKTILSEGMQNKIDAAFLSNYRRRDLIKYSYFKGFSIFSYPKFGNNVVVHKSDFNLVDFFNLSDFREFKDNVKFLPMPISNRNYVREAHLYRKILSSGFDIQKPLVYGDSFFLDDFIHLKPQFRGLTHYKMRSVLGKRLK